MCDYSLATLQTRLAVEGEELVVYRFPTGSIGLTELGTPQKNFAAGNLCSTRAKFLAQYAFRPVHACGCGTFPSTCSGSLG